MTTTKHHDRNTLTSPRRETSLVAPNSLLVEEEHDMIDDEESKDPERLESFVQIIGAINERYDIKLGQKDERCGDIDSAVLETEVGSPTTLDATGAVLGPGAQTTTDPDLPPPPSSCLERQRELRNTTPGAVQVYQQGGYLSPTPEDNDEDDGTIFVSSSSHDEEAREENNSSVLPETLLIRAVLVQDNSQHLVPDPENASAETLPYPPPLVQTAVVSAVPVVNKEQEESGPSGRRRRLVHLWKDWRIIGLVGMLLLIIAGLATGLVGKRSGAAVDRASINESPPSIPRTAFPTEAPIAIGPTSPPSRVDDDMISADDDDRGFDDDSDDMR